jgi:hypothetical protein
MMCPVSPLEIHLTWAEFDRVVKHTKDTRCIDLELVAKLLHDVLTPEEYDEAERFVRDNPESRLPQIIPHTDTPPRRIVIARGDKPAIDRRPAVEDATNVRRICPCETGR